MLEQLKLIAAGDKNTKTIKELERKFNKSKEPVSRLIEKLRLVRNDLGRSIISDQIDIILNDDEFGKNKIRDDIQFIINHHVPCSGRSSRGWAKPSVIFCSGVRTMAAA